MSLLFIDGFDHCDPAALRPNGLACAGYGKAVYANTCQSVDGRRAGGKALRYDANHTRAETLFARTIASPKSTLITGCALLVEALPTAGVSMPLLYIENNASTPQRHEVRLASDGAIEVYKRESSDTKLGVSWVPLTPGAWRYLELKVVEGSGSGSVEVRLDGQAVLTLTGLTVTTGAKLYKAGVCVKTTTSAIPVAVRIDDFYLADTAGSLNNTYLGDVRIDVLRPMGAGDTGQWTPTGAAANWDTVNEALPDEADYVSATTLGLRDLYQMTDLPAMSAPTVLGVQSVLLAHKSDAGATGIKAVVKSGAAETTGALHNLASDPLYFTHLFETDPNTATAWTEATLNAAQFGQQVDS
jgi:hypothetical protein